MPLSPPSVRLALGRTVQPLCELAKQRLHTSRRVRIEMVCKAQLSNKFFTHARACQSNSDSCKHSGNCLLCSERQSRQDSAYEPSWTRMLRMYLVSSVLVPA